jgi:hypothetical protein
MLCRPYPLTLCRCGSYPGCPLRSPEVACVCAISCLTPRTAAEVPWIVRSALSCPAVELDDATGLLYKGLDTK